jgi:monoamine oxidase
MSRKVVIIGGGISGLATAAELLRQDCQVIVMEAKARLGGRIHTVFEGQCPIDLGAEFLHGESDTLQSVMTAAGLSHSEISLQNKFFENGKLNRKDIWSLVSKVFHRINPQQRDCSMEEFLLQDQASPETRRMISSFVNGFHAARMNLVSAHSLLRGEYAAEHMHSQKQGRPDAGYSALIDFLAEDIRAHGGKILTNTPVGKINWQPGSVRVECQPDNETVSLQADAAVITVSLGVLKSRAIEFVPPLPQKQEAIEQLQFGNVVKISLVFAEKCWPHFEFIQAPGEPLPTWWTDPRGSILTGWAGGPQADALLSLSSAELELVALQTLKKIFKKQADDLQTKFVTSQHHDWAHDPHIRGAYSYIPVGGLDLPKKLAEPVAHTLFFAGEATVFDAQTGLVSEAYETGLRAARELASHAGI